MEPDDDVVIFFSVMRIFGLECNEVVFSVPDNILYFVPKADDVANLYQKIIRREEQDIVDVISLIFIREYTERFGTVERFKIPLAHIDFEKDFAGAWSTWIKNKLLYVIHHNTLWNCFSSLDENFEKTIFWNAFVNFQVYTHIPPEDFKSFLMKLTTEDLRQICNERELVNYYKQAFEYVLYRDTANFPIIYELMWPTATSQTKPIKFNIDRKLKQLVKKYIVEEDESHDYCLCSLSENGKALKAFCLTSTEILALREKVEEIHSRQQYGRFSVNTEIAVSDGFEQVLEIVEIETKEFDSSCRVKINIKMMELELQKHPRRLFSSLLLNHNNQFLLSKPISFMGELERALYCREAEEYPQSPSYHIAFRRFALIFVGIDDALLQHGHAGFLDSLLSYAQRYILNYIASDGLLLEFSQAGRSNTSYKAKCSMLYSNINVFLRLYHTFVHGSGQKITANLFNIELEKGVDLPYSQFSSCCHIRHVYPNPSNTDINIAKKVLFSTHLCPDHEDIRCFYDWLMKYAENESVPKYFIDFAEKLSEFRILPLDNGIVKMNDFAKVVLCILKRLHEFDEIPILPTCDHEVWKAIGVLYCMKWLVFDDHLFSNDEAASLDFILTDRYFTNNLALRNRYCHGGSMMMDENDARMDYGIGLLVLAFMILAIDIDLHIAIDYPNTSKVDFGNGDSEG